MQFAAASDCDGEKFQIAIATNNSTQIIHKGDEVTIRRLTKDKPDENCDWFVKNNSADITLGNCPGCGGTNYCECEAFEFVNFEP